MCERQDQTERGAEHRNHPKTDAAADDRPLLAKLAIRVPANHGLSCDVNLGVAGDEPAHQCGSEREGGGPVLCSAQHGAEDEQGEGRDGGLDSDADPERAQSAIAVKRATAKTQASRKPGVATVGAMTTPKLRRASPSAAVAADHVSAPGRP